ncbi:hypothetical protein IW262DRAFT_653065 [Armillaria fumosa]|nr:hypothetical protein IW262DRAFT_653065 [Armillaria fumosa]
MHLMASVMIEVDGGILCYLSFSCRSFYTVLLHLQCWSFFLFCLVNDIFNLSVRFVVIGFASINICMRRWRCSYVKRSSGVWTLTRCAVCDD